MIDLHIHTVNSDGDFTTKEILQEAEKNKLEIISITDHNNVNAYDDIENNNLRNLFSGKIITGTELEFAYNGRLFEILGYGFDLEEIKKTEIIIKGMVHSTIEGQEILLNKMKKICDKLNIRYSGNLRILNKNNMANDVMVDDILLYSENKEILNNMGIKDRSTFYRKHFCEPTSPFYLSSTEGKFSVEYVSDVIKKSGGKRFLAHPFVYGIDNLEEFLDFLVSNKLIDGIECYHRKHSEEQINWIVEYCNKNNLLKSGGSDKHTNNHKMGYANRGNTEIKKELVNNWIDNINFNKYYIYER